mmetsp:Transcript_101284/g.321657  ORF Transcript_101284/g.321657 Transcript_101284/m.321657 type:complete len:617 (+) Transcript_101284:1-1851(+)
MHGKQASEKRGGAPREAEGSATDVSCLLLRPHAARRPASTSAHLCPHTAAHPPVPSRGEELPLEAVQAMHAALALRGRTPELEPQLAAVELLAQLVHGLAPDVLHAVPEALDQIGDVPVHGALVLHGPAHALGHLDGARGAEVPVVRALPHGIDGAHAAVELQARAVVGVEVLARGLLGASQQAPAHGHAGSHAKRLDDVPRAADAAVCQHRHAVRSRQARDVVDSGRLRAAAGADLLRRADGADAHAHAQGVDAALDEVLGLALRDDVAADDLEAGELLLHPAEDVVLEGAVALAAVDDNGVHARGDQRSDPVSVARPGAHRGRHHEGPLLVLRGQRVVCLLFQVSAGDERHKVPRVGHDGQLALLGGADDPVGVGEFHAFLRRDEVLHCSHHLTNTQSVAVGHEVRVALRDEAHELRAHLAVLGHREAREATPPTQLVQLGEQHCGLDADGVHDEAVPELLDLQDLLDLVLHAEVRVDDSQPALQRHGNGHPGLRDGVHGAGHDGGLQLDLARDVGLERHLVHAEGDVPRQADDVVVGVAHAVLRGVEDVSGTEAIEQVVVVFGQPLGPGGSLVLGLGRSILHDRAWGAATLLPLARHHWKRGAGLQPHSQEPK